MIYGDWTFYDINKANFMKDTHITLLDFRFLIFKKKKNPNGQYGSSSKQDQLNLIPRANIHYIFVIHIRKIKCEWFESWLVVIECAQ